MLHNDNPFAEMNQLVASATGVLQVDRKTAKRLMAAMLKDRFPSTSFSIRQSYGGYTINYENGPSVAQVELITGVFLCSAWDGVEDISRSVNSEWGGKPVYFDISSLSVNRHYTADFLRLVLDRLHQDLPSLLPTLPNISQGDQYAWIERSGVLSDHQTSKDVNRLVNSVDEWDLASLSFGIKDGRYSKQSVFTNIGEFFVALGTYALEELEKSQPDVIGPLRAKAYVTRVRRSGSPYIFGVIYTLYQEQQAREQLEKEKETRRLQEVTLTFSGAILKRIYAELNVAHLEPNPDEGRIKQYILQMVEMGMDQ